MTTLSRRQRRHWQRSKRDQGREWSIEDYMALTSGGAFYWLRPRSLRARAKWYRQQIAVWRAQRRYR